VFPIQRIAPTIDLVLLSHGDLAHAGLFPYAFCRWGLRAPSYSTLPVQATARIAVTEDVEGLRDEQEMDDSDMGEDLSAPGAETNQTANTGDEPMEDEGQTKPPAKERKPKFVATIHEVNEAFDSINTLRYSQPTHLQGAFPFPSAITHNPMTTQASARVLPSPHSAPATLLAGLSGKSALHLLEPSSTL
jgi:cleavage and polyadenylation specificity factor subunit 2